MFSATIFLVMAGMVLVLIRAVRGPTPYDLSLIHI